VRRCSWASYAPRMSLTAGSSPASAEEVGIATEAFESSARWASGIVCSMISTLSPHPSVAQGDADPSFSELASSRACAALARAQKSRLKVIALRTCRWSGHADCRRTRPDATLDRPRSAVEHIPTVSQGRLGDGRGDVIVKTVITRGGLVCAYEGKYVTAYADGETADLVKSSQVK